MQCRVVADQSNVISLITVADYRPSTVRLQVNTLLPCVLLLTPEIEVISKGNNCNCPEICNLNSRLPLFQGSNTSSKYFVINSTCKSSI
jgi:hypothetical protein